MEQACVGSAGGILWKPVMSRLTFVIHGFFSVVRAISSSSDFPLPDTCDWFIIEALSAGVPSPSTCRRAFSGISAAVNSFPNFFHSIIAGGYHPTSISAVMATSLANSRRQHGKFLHMSQREIPLVMELTPLADIKPFMTEYRVQVKVLHTWRQYTKLSGESLEIILSDAHGTKIHASCKKTYLDKLTRKLSNVLSIGMWRNIENFSINNPSVSYRPTNHQYKINFIYGTDITPSTILNDNMFLSLVDFQTIQSGVEDPNILIDVIGQVSDLGALETVQCSGKARKKIEFSLTDLVGHRITCCLWGKFAESIKANCDAAGEDSVICLLCFVKIGTYRNEIQISNSYDASQVFFNPPIMEAEAFLKRDVASNALTLVESNQDKLEREIRRDPWMQYAIRDIVELRQLTQTKQCRIIATIYAIDKDWGWYYFGCKTCQKKVTQISRTVKIVNGKEIVTHVWFCEKCDDKVTEVQDSCMGERWYWRSLLMLFDWIASGIVPENAADLLNGSFDELKDVESFPEAITSLIGKTFMFGVYIERVTITTESFTQSDVGTNNLSCSQGSILLMDSEANEDTVVTPSSKRKEHSNISSTTKKQCTRTKLKESSLSVLSDFELMVTGGDYNNKASQLSDITTRRSTCLNIQPRNLLPAFSKSDSVKKPNPMEWPTSQLNEAEEEDDFQSSVNHSSSVTIVNPSPIPDEQRSRILTMADIFRNMFQGGQSSSTTPSLQTLKTIEYLDEGDPTYICDYCGAKMWYGERIEKKRMSKKPKFSLCCGLGQVQLPLLKESPEILKILLHGDDEISSYFRENIRQLNMVFSFTSLGGKVDRCLPQGRGPKMFQLQGENYHLMGSLKPPAGEEPKFSQLYIVDTETKIDKRASIIGYFLNS
ncbi:hypothetical protein Bca4012_044187 [Brassica carinata]